MRLALRRFLLAPLVAALAAGQAAAQPAPLRGLDAYVERARAEWEVPGMAVAVVKDDRIVYARGFGERELGSGEPVDEHTSFSAASTTKAFTATAMAILVDEGKVRWDNPVSLHLPELRLAVPGLTAELTVRDLLSHRTGLPTADFLWYASGSGADEIVRRMRFLRPFAAPREQYMYNNNAYMLAGRVVEAASGISWGEFVRTRILEPLGMTGTLTGHRGLEARENLAAPHRVLDDTLRAIRYLDFDNIGPAGSMNSSAHDLALWLRFHLAGGVTPAGVRLVSEAAHREMLTPQTPIPAERYYPAARLASPSFTAYGLGWFLQDHRGRLLAMHTGSIDGMNALVAIVPAEELGVVVLLNREQAELRHALMYRIVDAYLGQPARDWSAEVHALYAPGHAGTAERRRDRLAHRVEGTRPTLPLEAYAGTFADPDSLLAPLVVAVEEGVLVASLGGRRGTLEHWHHDVFRLRWAYRPHGDAFASFVLDHRGRISSIQLEPRILLVRDD